MSSSPTFIVSHMKEVGKEQLLARDQGRRHTSSPRSRPKSRLEVLMMDLARAQAEMRNILGRTSSVEVSLHGTSSPSPTPGRRGSSPSAETMNVSVPSTFGYLVPLSQSQVRRSERLLMKPRPDYRLLNRSAIWQDRSITEVDEDAEYDDPAPSSRETQLKTVAGEMTFRCGPGEIVNRDIVREGQDVVIEIQIG